MYTGFSKKEKDKAISLYKKGLTLREISQKIGTNSGTLSKWFKDIPKQNNKAGPPKGNTPWNKGKPFKEMIGNKFAVKKEIKRSAAHYRARKMITGIKPCEMCGKTKNSFQMVIHHIDENPFNNNIKNLMRLCRSCHLKIHRDKTQIAKNKKYEQRRPRKVSRSPFARKRDQR